MRGEWAEKVGGRHRSGGSGGRENWERKRKQKELGGMRKRGVRMEREGEMCMRVVGEIG